MGEWRPKSFVPADSEEWRPASFIPAESASTTAIPPSIADAQRSQAWRSAAVSGLKGLPWIGSAAGALFGAPAVATGPWGVTVPMATAGAGAGMGETLKNAGLQFLGEPVPQGLDAEKAVLRAAFEKGVMPEATGGALVGLAGGASRGLTGIARMADRRAADAAERRVLAGYKAKAPSEAAEAALTRGTESEIAAKRDLGSRILKTNKVIARADIGAAKADAAATVAESRARASLQEAATREAARKKLAAAKNIAPDVKAAVDATTATRREAASATAQEIGKQSKRVKPITIGELSKKGIALQERHYGPTTDPVRKQLTQQIKDRIAEVLPEQSLGFLRGRKIVYNLEEAQKAKQAFGEITGIGHKAIASGNIPPATHKLDLIIEDAFKQAIEKRAPRVKGLNKVTSAAIQDERGIRRLAQSQGQPSVNAVRGAAAERVAGVKNESSNALADIRLRESQAQAEARRRAAEAAAEARRKSIESAAEVRARVRAETAQIKAEHEAQVAELRKQKAVAVARALATTPGPSDLLGIHLGLAPGVRVGSPKLAPTADFLSGIFGSNAMQKTAQGSPLLLQMLLERAQNTNPYKEGQ